MVLLTGSIRTPFQAFPVECSSRTGRHGVSDGPVEPAWTGIVMLTRSKHVSVRMICVEWGRVVPGRATR